MKRMLIYSMFCVIIDQVIKFFIENTNAHLTIIKNFFSITYAKNNGAAFSILSGNVFLLIIVTLAALVLIYFCFIKNKKISLYEYFIYGLLLGGILGNLLDRIFRGYVVDYLDFNLFGYDFPIFNFADICIVVSIILLVIFNIKVSKHDNR